MTGVSIREAITRLEEKLESLDETPLDTSRCGTHAGAQAHRKRDEEVCNDCKVAQSVYAREFRAKNRASYAKRKRRDNARSRALTRLGRSHPTELAMLIEEELADEVVA